MTKRAILYARVSGDDTKYATSGIESQLGDCRTYAQKQGYAIVGEHFETPEKATSGADWLPEIEALLKLACTGTFDVLVSSEVIEHTTSQKDYLKNCYSLLKPGAFLLLSHHVSIRLNAYVDCNV